MNLFEELKKEKHRLNLTCPIPNIEDIVLYKKYNEINSQLLRLRYCTHYMRTECNVIEPKLVVPQTLRQYFTELYLVNNTIHDYDSLTTTPEWKKNPGTSCHNEVNLYEVFDDCGSDGHIENRLIGWAFIDNNLLKKRLSDPKIKKYGYEISDIIMEIIRDAEIEHIKTVVI